MARLVAGLLLAACSSGAPGAGSNASASAVQVARQCPTETVEGIDVFDGQGAISWPAVRDAGVAFALIKATQGTYDTQATFADDWRSSKSAGLIRGAYHFFDPTEDGAAQARYFLSVAGAPEAGDLPPVLDVECPDGDADCLGTGSAGEASAGDVRARIGAFLDTVDQATGRMPFVYTFPAYFADDGIDASGLEAYPLFLAFIPPAAAAGDQAQEDGGPLPCLGVPPPWSSATMWQYTFQGSVPGVAGAVDRDRFLGSIEALQALAGQGPESSIGCP